MDGQRFDALARAMAGGATRRRALRLAGGGLAGALLAAAGLGRRAGAQDGVPCGDLEARCDEQAVAACGPKPSNSASPEHDAWLDCRYSVPVCQSYVQACRVACEYTSGCPPHGCPRDEFCNMVINHGDRLQCRCVSLA